MWKDIKTFKFSKSTKLFFEKLLKMHNFCADLIAFVEL
nr:MAG TPA: hypothetical protein [Caudoviricetes sp.]